MAIDVSANKGASDAGRLHIVSRAKAGPGPGRWVMGGLFVVAGTLHFVFPQAYLRIMPPALPWPQQLIAISGAAEIAGGLGVCLEKTRRPAAWGLALLLVAVWPANIYMAIAHLRFAGPLGAIASNSWSQWLRVPLQIPLIAWALRYRK